jgi:hypothetical protein
MAFIVPKRKWVRGISNKKFLDDCKIENDAAKRGKEKTDGK